MQIKHYVDLRNAFKEVEKEIHKNHRYTGEPPTETEFMIYFNSLTQEQKEMTYLTCRLYVSQFTFTVESKHGLN